MDTQLPPLEDHEPPKNANEALRWAVMSQRSLAFNLGYLDVPTHEDEELPPMTWQQLSALHEVEYNLLNDFIIRRMIAGETLTPEYTTGPEDEDDDPR